MPLKINDGTTTNDVFADDSSLYTSDKQLLIVQSNLQMCLIIMYLHGAKNKYMKLNPLKRKCMIIATKQRKLDNAELNIFIF